MSFATRFIWSVRSPWNIGDHFNQLFASIPFRVSSTAKLSQPQEKNKRSSVALMLRKVQPTCQQTSWNYTSAFEGMWSIASNSSFFQSPQSPPTTKTAFKREVASHETSMGLRTWETWILLDTPMQHLLRCANQVARSLTDDFQRLGEIAQTTDWGYWLNLSTCPKTPNWNGSILHSHDRS